MIENAEQAKPNIWLSIAFGIYFVVVVIGIGHLFDLHRSLTRQRRR
jgi:hypothetical protein